MEDEGEAGFWDDGDNCGQVVTVAKVVERLVTTAVVATINKFRANCQRRGTDLL